MYTIAAPRAAASRIFSKSSSTRSAVRGAVGSDLGFDSERLGELDELPLGDAHIDHARSWMDCASNSTKLFSDPILGASAVAAYACRNRQNQILCYGQIRQHRGVLVHDGKSEPLGLGRRKPSNDWQAANLDSACVRLHVARRNPHQR